MTEKETKKTVSEEEVCEKLGVAGKIWKEIKDLPIDMYALADQTVRNHVEMKPVPGDVLFLKPKSQAVIASLGSAIGSKYTVNATDGGFITVERVETIPVADDDYVYYQRRGKVEKILRKKLL
jgi:hypothetical protein